MAKSVLRMRLESRAKKRGGLAGMLKKAAGPDTTESGDPDFAAMFNRFIKERVIGAKSVKADTLGGQAFSKGIMLGDEDKK